MKCTACQAGHLKAAQLENFLPSLSCNYCGGHLVFLHDYLRWKELADDEVMNPSENLSVEASETKSAMVCPKTGRLMMKYRISSKTEHRLDLSSEIGAIWIDHKEWQLLKSEGLIFSLNQVFTQAWQNSIKDELFQKMNEVAYEKFFADDFSKIKAFKSFMYDSGKKSDIIAYLLDER